MKNLNLAIYVRVPTLAFLVSFSSSFNYFNCPYFSVLVDFPVLSIVSSFLLKSILSLLLTKKKKKSII